ncbi:beta-propeller domain-containing protein [Catenovulum agarivorans DS-2]|uniref:Beta-propeller domain-containing protein n=1 Tax=Catenovulum agarivorans DS-2 TaxID=1328313 RepID=W7Q936_9ALTE|nr:beta-propeller domain-containing protein [Catenovulum agarivorans]EWH08521.1 beta-propeller domain-containing protein [Catenovulum agarivorans DS-2]
MNALLNAKTSLPVLLVASLAACGGSLKTEDDEQPSQQSVPDLNQQPIQLSPLSKASKSEFLTHYKNGLYLSASNSGYVYRDGVAVPEFAEATSDDAAADGGSTGNFSQTVTQESGVGEADRVKYDGNYIYVNDSGDYQNSVSPHVRILKRNADASLTQVATTHFKAQTTEVAITPDSMYLAGDNLILVNEQNYFYTTDTAIDVDRASLPFGDALWYPYESAFYISIQDVAVPEQPAVKTEFKIDGRLISSRVIDGNLYLVSSYAPTLPYEWLSPTTDDEKIASYNKVAALDESELLPQVEMDQTTTTNLVEADNCYLPQDSTNKDGFDALVTLSKVSLANPQQIESVCINASVAGFYASQQSIYLFGSEYQRDANARQTIIHQFKLSDTAAFDYLGSAIVDGQLNWNNPHLRLSEYQDVLRVVTTQTDWSNQDDRFTHKLYTLQHDADSQSLKIIAELPNDSQPAKIGKPNEDIYAVRYFANKAYIVTFERTDPLYVIDVADAANPKITGELEITGFSSYLHPLDDNLLLGFGQEVDPNGGGLVDPAEDGQADEPEIQPGLKLALFDVSDINNPIELGKHVFVDGHSEVEYNYRALAYVKVSDSEHRIAIPVNSWHVEKANNSYKWTHSNTLGLLNVIEADNSASLNFIGEIEPEQQSHSWDNRGIIHDDIVYYIQNHDIWQSNWSDTDVVNGPY